MRNIKILNAFKNYNINDANNAKNNIINDIETGNNTSIDINDCIPYIIFEWNNSKKNIILFLSIITAIYIYYYLMTYVFKICIIENCYENIFLKILNAFVVGAMAIIICGYLFGFCVVLYESCKYVAKYFIESLNNYKSKRNEIIAHNIL